jgi:D-tyrosyl-tRNA(Tyr) deacylase
MRALVQRVSSASVRVDGEPVATIGGGMLVLLGIAVEDTEAEADRMVAKLAKLRIFEDAEGRINEPPGARQTLCVSQFTLYADTGKGNRPSFVAAAPPERAELLYEMVCEGLGAERGVFGARMEVELVNDGPLTLMVEVRR